MYTSIIYQSIAISPQSQEGVFDWSPDDDELDNDVDLESSLRGDDLPQWKRISLWFAKKNGF